MRAREATGGGSRPEAQRTPLILLRGIPGSGKSTIARELVRQLGDAEAIAREHPGPAVGA